MFSLLLGRLSTRTTCSPHKHPKRSLSDTDHTDWSSLQKIAKWREKFEFHCSGPKGKEGKKNALRSFIDENVTLKFFVRTNRSLTRPGEIGYKKTTTIAFCFTRRFHLTTRKQRCFDFLDGRRSTVQSAIALLCRQCLRIDAGHILPWTYWPVYLLANLRFVWSRVAKGATKTKPNESSEREWILRYYPWCRLFWSGYGHQIEWIRYG